MEDTGMVQMFESLIATGLKNFLGCPAFFSEAALTEFFANGSVRDGLVVSTVNGVHVEFSEKVFAEAFELPIDGLTDVSDVPKNIVFDARSLFSASQNQVSISCLKKELKIEFCLLHDILAKTMFVKAGSFDAVTHKQRFFAAKEPHWFDLPYDDLIAKWDAERPVVTESDTDEDVETMDVGAAGGDQQVQFSEEEPEDVEMREDKQVDELIDADEKMSLEDILMTIPVDVPLASAGIEITKITMGKEIQIPGVDEKTQYLASLPKIPADDKGKKILVEKDPDDVKKIRETLSLHINNLERRLFDRFDAHDRTYRVLFNHVRHDMRDHKNLLSLDLKSYQQKVSIQVGAAALDTVDVRREVKAVNAKVDILSSRLDDVKKDVEATKEAISHQLLEFQSQAQANHIVLTDQLGQLVDYINRGGNAKKGEGESSRGPQPPPAVQIRDSGNAGGSGDVVRTTELTQGDIDAANRQILERMMREDRERERERMSKRRS
ncbi:hypothetical protein F511_33555 [Dorcoceras hygrometricum]|uniref:Dystroglycan-like n=1 Tax=Dorcoceras hygrometricum TaxID=472368 RepID=A0A2Z7D0Q6_9LAMI|nr:hypothetical protein F511_33555 [Dorcoceras hygrometricum]